MGSCYRCVSEAQGDTSVFINCPIDENYEPLLRATVFTILACGLVPRLALEEQDAGTIRLEKIRRLIASSRLSIHDISRTTVDAGSGLPRFNMPFELGLDLGARHYGAGYLKTKRLLIIDTERYRYRQFLSDIAGQDIAAHHDSPGEAITRVRTWLNSQRAGGPPLLGPAAINASYDTFLANLPVMCDKSRLDDAAPDFNDFLFFAVEWVKLTA